MSPHTAQHLGKRDFKEWNERMAQAFDPNTYHESSSGIVAWVERSRVRTLLRLLDVHPHHHVLEVGVGAGNILAKVQSAARTGIDLSPFLLAKAGVRLGGGATLIEGDAEELDQHVDPDAFDRIYCSEVLEHVQRPEVVLAQMARALKPGGIAVVSVPNERFINGLKTFFKRLGVFRLLFPTMADHMEDAWHLHLFDRGLLQRLCKQHFDIERIVAVPFVFLPVRLVAKLRLRSELHDLPSLLRCPECHGILEHENSVYVCRACHLNFQEHEGVPILVKGMMILPSDTIENRFKNFFKRWPGLYRVLFAVVGPALLTGLTSKKFAARFDFSTKILHAGSGTLKIGDHAINVDIFPLTGVDVAADLRALPFADNTFDAATSEQVLEHVPQPWRAAAEIERVVRPGGFIHIAVPFVFPWHPSPSDYTRWTLEGIADLFPHCTVVEKGIAAGPCSAFTAFMAAFLATILSLGIRPLQGILQYVFLVLLIPVKLLDLVFAHFPGSELCAADLWVVMRKEK